MSNLAHNTPSNLPFVPPPMPPEKRPQPMADYYQMVAQLPPDSTLILHDISWEDYEELLEKVGEASGLRISYCNGELQVMTLSTIHENYSRLLQMFIGLLSVNLRIRIISFGSATMKKGKKLAGAEPDCCFYIQSATLIGKKIQIDFNQDPPPDVVVEIDVHHKSTGKFEIYAALGVSEMWLYDEKRMRFYLLREGRYVEIVQSQALPILTSPILTGFLERSRHEDQYDILLAFEEWLHTLPQ